MSDDTRSTFVRALHTLLTELFDGPPGDACFVLNRGDPGLIKQLQDLDAVAASTRTIPGRTTVAAHVDHVLYGLDLLNRWADGEANPWADADWGASWKRSMVNEDQWRHLLARLWATSERWKRAVLERQEWDDLAATGAMASAVHAAYHLGAIRQILAAAGQYEPAV